MTLEEVCKKYGYSESSLKTTFPTVQRSILKKTGVKIIKEGRGENAVYKEEIENDMRAVTIFEEPKEEVEFDEESFKLMDWEFLTFLAIISSPMLVFRGSYNDFLKYIEVPVTANNRKLLQNALNNLYKKDFISYTVDKTNGKWFIAGLYREVERKNRIGIEMVRTCKQLAQENNKRSWVPLVKTWAGVQRLAKKKRTYTIKDLQDITGLSVYQIRESSKVLEMSNIYITSKEYLAFNRCIGKKATLNGFYNKP